MKYYVEKPTNCPNCNAALQSSVCQYCGTRTGWDEGEMDFNPPVVTIPISVTSEQIEKVFSDFAQTAYNLGGSKKEGEADE